MNRIMELADQFAVCYRNNTGHTAPRAALVAEVFRMEAELAAAQADAARLRHAADTYLNKGQTVRQWDALRAAIDAAMESKA